MQVALNSFRYMCALIKQSRYVNVSSEALLSVVWKSRERLGVREKYIYTLKLPRPAIDTCKYIMHIILWQSGTSK